jgi:hypothetical protein
MRMWRAREGIEKVADPVAGRETEAGDGFGLANAEAQEAWL